MSDAMALMSEESNSYKYRKMNMTILSLSKTALISHINCLKGQNKSLPLYQADSANPPKKKQQNRSGLNHITMLKQKVLTHSPFIRWEISLSATLMTQPQ